MPGAPRVWSLPPLRRLAGPVLAVSLLAAPAAALDLEVIDTATGRRVAPGGVIDLASVRAGAVGQRVFRVVNREPGPVAVHGCELVNGKGSAFALRRCLVPPREGFTLLQPGMSGRFAVEWRSETPGRYSATVRLEPGLFSFRVVGWVRGDEVIDWGEVIDLGRVRAGAATERRFWYANTRDRLLRLRVGVNGEGFEVSRQPPGVEPGRDGTFDVRLVAGQPGIAQSLVVVRNVDSGELALEFSLRARVVAESEVQEDSEAVPEEEPEGEPAPP